MRRRQLFVLFVICLAESATAAPSLPIRSLATKTSTAIKRKRPFVLPVKAKTDALIARANKQTAKMRYSWRYQFSGSFGNTARRIKTLSETLPGRLAVSEIGKSGLGNPILRLDLPAQPSGDATPPLNVLISVGVHGSERIPVEVGLRLIDYVANQPALSQRVNLSVIFANPDGEHLGTRDNGLGDNVGRSAQPGHDTPEFLAFAQSVASETHDLFLDIHGHKHKEGFVLIGEENDPLKQRIVNALPLAWLANPGVAVPGQKARFPEKTSADGGQYVMDAPGAGSTTNRGTFRQFIRGLGTAASFTVEIPRLARPSVQIAGAIKMFESAVNEVSLLPRKPATVTLRHPTRFVPGNNQQGPKLVRETVALGPEYYDAIRDERLHNVTFSDGTSRQIASAYVGISRMPRYLQLRVLRAHKQQIRKAMGEELGVNVNDISMVSLSDFYLQERNQGSVPSSALYEPYLGDPAISNRAGTAYAIREREFWNGQSLVHEALHGVSQAFVNQANLPELSEGITEYFAYKVTNRMRKRGNRPLKPDVNHPYYPRYIYAEALVSRVGENLAKEALLGLNGQNFASLSQRIDGLTGISGVLARAAAEIANGNTAAAIQLINTTP